MRSARWRPRTLSACRNCSATASARKSSWCRSRCSRSMTRRRSWRPMPRPMASGRAGVPHRQEGRHRTPAPPAGFCRYRPGRGRRPGTAYRHRAHRQRADASLGHEPGAAQSAGDGPRRESGGSEIQLSCERRQRRTERTPRPNARLRSSVCNTVLVISAMIKAFRSCRPLRPRGRVHAALRCLSWWRSWGSRST